MSTEPIAAGLNDVTVRAQFEKWYAGDMPKSLERAADGTYKYMNAQIAWGVWKAATAVEREACAKLVSAVGDYWEGAGDMQKMFACDYLEDAIRMRSNASCRKGTTTLDELGLTEEEWHAMSDEDRDNLMRDIALDRLDWGYSLEDE